MSMYPPENPFATNPEFVDSDHRTERQVAPVSIEQMVNKHQAMFAEWNVDGKSVLDLGCCHGASGHWVLSKGATRYVGVEAQDKYAEKCRELLDIHGDKAEVRHQSIDQFFESNKETFDTVLLLGVIYGFLDHFDLLKKLTAVARETVIIEGMYPSYTHCKPDGSVIEVYDKHPMNFASENANLFAAGSRISPRALDVLMKTMGFEAVGRHPVVRRIEESIDNYNADFNEVHGARYICIYRKSSAVEKKLTDAFNDGEEVHRVSWEQLDKSVDAYNPKLPPMKSPYWDAEANPIDQLHQRLSQNIPEFDLVNELSADYCALNLNKSAEIAVYGMPALFEVPLLIEKGFEKLSAGLVPQNLLECLDAADVGARIVDVPSDHQSECYDVVIANWVLHLQGEREPLLKHIYDSLRPGGTLILSEKVKQSDAAYELFQQQRRNAGVTEEEMKAIDESMAGILVSYPLDWYLLALRDLGFVQVEILRSHLGFVTFRAVK